MPCSRLPDDVWLHVGVFMSRSALRDLLAVNSVFLRLALQSRYGNLQLAEFCDKDVKIMRRVREPMIAPYVRRVKLVLKRAERRDESNPSTYYGSTYTFSDEEVLTELACTCKALPKVASFDLQWRSSSGWSLAFNPTAFGPVLRTIWTALGPRLRNARLVVDSCYLDAVCQLDGSVAVCLSELDLRLSVGGARHPVSSCAVMADTMKTLAQRLIMPVRTHLRTLKLALPEFNEESNPHPAIGARAFFATLEATRFTHISVLTVQSAFHGATSANEGCPLTVFVRNNLNTITALAISPHQEFGYGPGYDFGGFLARASASVWTGISRLSLCVPTRRSSYDDDEGQSTLTTGDETLRTGSGIVALAAVLSSMNSSLIHVILSGRFLGGKELLPILSSLDAGADLSPLKSFTANLQTLQPSACDMLAMLMPSIRTLQLKIHAVSADEGFVMSQEDIKLFHVGEAQSSLGPGRRRYGTVKSPAQDAFTAEMRTRSYPAWPVHRINVEHEYYARCGNDRPPAFGWTAEAAFLKAVPGVKQVTSRILDWQSHEL